MNHPYVCDGEPMCGRCGRPANDRVHVHAVDYSKPPADDPSFELTVHDVGGSSRTLNGGGRLMVETIDATLINPLFTNLSVKRTSEQPKLSSIKPQIGNE